MKRIWIAAAALSVALTGAAFSQALGSRAPAWAQPLLAADSIASTGGRAQLQNEGVDFAVRATIAPYQGGVARVIRVEGLGDETRLFLRRFTGHPSAGWWLWGPETPTTGGLTAEERRSLETLASAAISATGGAAPACPQGEQAFVEILSRGRATVASRACVVSGDGVSALVRTLSDLAGSRTEEELRQSAIDELIDADRAFNSMAQADGVPAAFAHFAADNAHQFTPRQEPAATPEARAALWAEWGEQDRLVWAPQYAQVSERGDMGWTWGNGVRTNAEGETFHSRYVTVWKRNYDGAWRFVADIGVPGPPPAE
ncbi:MAG: hypothetical protein GC189_14635 [Alphaproteobacteria bacterium]|nr:hypothetical protein [Alphaproteobacteria bacterium]